MIRWRCRADLNCRIRVLQTLALPLGHGTGYKSRNALAFLIVFGAGDEARTRYLHLGKVALYQMSYIRILRTESLRGDKPPFDSESKANDKLWCLRAESNHRHGDFQSPALPTELSGHLAERVGFEPTVPLSITGFQDQLLKPLGHLSTW